MSIRPGGPSKNDLSGTYAQVTNVSSKVATGQAAASANVTAINAAITAVNAAGGGTVAIYTPGTYYLNDHILMLSNVRLWIEKGVTLRKVDGATGNVCMIRNANPLGAGPFTDQNIVIEGGGTIDGNQGNNSSPLVQADQTGATANTLLYGVQGDVAFIGVQGVTVRNIFFYDCNGFALQLLGNNLTVRDCTANTGRDFVHINGPSKGVDLRNLSGTSNDGFICLNAWDWHRSGPAVGDIQDVVIDRVEYLGTSGLHGATRAGTCVTFLPGTRSTGAGTGTANIRNVVVTNLRSEGAQVGAVQFLSDYDQLTGSEVSGAGTVENVLVNGGHFSVPAGASQASVPGVWVNKNNSGAPVDAETNLTLRNITFRNIHFDLTTATANGSNAVLVTYKNTTLAMQAFKFQDCSWTPPTAFTGQFLNVQCKSVLDSIEIDGLDYLGNVASTTAAAAVVVNTYNGSAASEIKYLGLHRLTTAPGVTVDNAVITLNGIIDFLCARDWNMTFSGGASDTQGIWFANAVAQLKDALLDGLRLTNPKELFRIGSGATGSIICKATVRDINLVGCTHPIYLNGSHQATITFRGGNIDSAANLARVDGSTLNLTLDGTTSSGAGATTITEVNTPTVRVFKCDRIALPLNTLVLTPGDGDYVYSSATPTTVVSGTGAGIYVYRAATGWVKLN